jgi:cell fate (sporulation/competence/biofilm development) regulator YlbF (YheA/YmcA/DUF963 family)
MNATPEATVILTKTRELCETIIGQPEFRAIRLRIETFLGDNAAQMRYQSVVEKGDALQHQQRMGMPLDGEAVAAFEKERDQLLQDPVAKAFLDAQQEMHRIQESVMQYVGKTFELGRVPAPEDFDSGSCGPSCGCDH